MVVSVQGCFKVCNFTTFKHEKTAIVEKTKSTVFRGKLTFLPQSSAVFTPPGLPFAVPPGPACLEDLDVSFCTLTSAFKCLAHLFLSCLHGPECQGLQEQIDLHQEMGSPVGQGASTLLVTPISTPPSLGESTQASGLPSACLLPHPPLSFPETHGHEEQQRKTQAFGVTAPWSSL